MKEQKGGNVAEWNWQVKQRLNANKDNNENNSKQEQEVHLNSIYEDGEDAMEAALLKVDTQIQEEGSYFSKKAEPSSVKSGVYRRSTNLKTPSTNGSVIAEDSPNRR